MSPATTLICTVGTSLLKTQLGALQRQPPAELSADDRALVRALAVQDWQQLALLLARRAPDDRLCGAEINSIHLMVRKRKITPDARILLLVSATELGSQSGELLKPLLQAMGHRHVDVVSIEGLVDSQPHVFRTRGLRNLARHVCAAVRNYGASQCAINATGGYKAQIAIAVMIGQATHVPVYYKHELFDDIIWFPPLPVSFDFDLWLQHSSTLQLLADSDDLIPRSELATDWDESLEALVEVEDLGNGDVVVLSPTGYIVHETFSHRFQRLRGALLPPPATRKLPCTLKRDEAHLRRHEEELLRFMERIRDEVPQIISCHSDYFHPDLSPRMRFRLTAGKLRILYRGRGWAAGIVAEIDRDATLEQQQALCFELNDWLRRSGLASS